MEKAEGHTLVPYSKSNPSLKVKDFKNHLFDFSEAQIDLSVISEINRKMDPSEYLK